MRLEQRLEQLASSGAACRRRGRAPRRRRRARSRRSGPRRPSRAAAPAPRSSSPANVVRRLGRDDDDERLRLERPGSLDDPVDHPPAEDRVQVLGRRRAHARPTASGHDDGCELGAGFGHGRHVGWGARIRTWDHGTKTRCLTTWPRPSESGRRVYPDGPVVPGRSAPVEQEHGQGDRREEATTTIASTPTTTSADGNEHDDQLRDGGEPRRRANAGRAVIPAEPEVAARRSRRRPRRRATTGTTPASDEDRLDRRDAERDLQPPAAQPARELALAMLDDEAGHAPTVDAARARRVGVRQHRRVVTQVGPAAPQRARPLPRPAARSPKRP